MHLNPFQHFLKTLKNIAAYVVKPIETNSLKKSEISKIYTWFWKTAMEIDNKH